MQACVAPRRGRPGLAHPQPVHCLSCRAPVTEVTFGLPALARIAACACTRPALTEPHDASQAHSCRCQRSSHCLRNGCACVCLEPGTGPRAPGADPAARARPGEQGRDVGGHFAWRRFGPVHRCRDITLCTLYRAGDTRVHAFRPSRNGAGATFGPQPVSACVSIALRRVCLACLSRPRPGTHALTPLGGPQG